MSTRLPVVHDRFFDQTTWRELFAYVAAQPMKPGSKSNGETDPHGHWSWKPIYDEQQNLADITRMLPDMLARTWQRVRDRLYPGEVGRAVLRSYANGYTYGTDGYFHFDSQRPDEDTIIIYMCEKWDPDWGGETVFLNNNNRDIYYAVLPAPNRVVVAPSNLEHAARAVSRACPQLRRTLMFKTRPRRSEGWERVSTWLVTFGALKHKHTRGSLHDHLMRVYSLMAARPCPFPACMGGALHSIYGTNRFKQQLLEPTLDRRAAVASVFGKEAENLAHLFSILDRPLTLETQGTSTNDKLLTSAGEMIEVTALQKEYLCLIEAANLLDQGQLDKWRNLKALWEAK